MTRAPRVAAVLALVSLLAIGAVTLAPYSWSLNRLTVHLYVFFRTDLPIAPDSATPEDYGRLLNVLLFVPLGAALAWWLGARWGWAVPLCVALSLGVELAQALPGVARQASLGDVACNTLGAALGALGPALLRGRAARRSGGANRPI